MTVDLAAEAARLKALMDQQDNINLFISEGAGVESIVAEMLAQGREVPRDAFVHVKLDAINPGKWFGEQFAKMLGAEKTLVQKSGYYARAAAANIDDLRLIKSCTDLAVECALRRESGVIGHDEDKASVLRAIEFPRIKGGKPFNIDTPWFTELLAAIGQPKGARVAVKH
jgi:pyrophosphate--fructose-6-phosphate 1-phosphotransferase